MGENQPKIKYNFQNSIFKIQKQNSASTYFIPAYPRGYIEEIVFIDSQRRTVTAKFVLLITISLKDFVTIRNVKHNNQEFQFQQPSIHQKMTNIQKQKTKEEEIKQFIKENLIVEFGYNQIIYIPQHITLENSPYLISKVINNHSHDKYVTYRIKGQIQCNAYFDLMFFPFRKIQVQNNLCLRSQQFRCSDGQQVIIKYNIMTLMEQQHKKYKQFIPYSLRQKYGPYQLQWQQKSTISSEKQLNTIVNPDVINTLKQIFGFAQNKKNKQDKAKEIPSAMIIVEQNEQNSKQNIQSWQQQLHPFKHMVFRFQMTSMKIPFLLQQEIPIWVITIITLFLYHSQPSIGSKYSSIILLLVSFIAVITDFRFNNPSQPIFTFFQAKLVLLLIVPILLIISTQFDYYNSTNFQSRQNQAQNPYFIVSIIIASICFLFTLFSLAIISIREMLANNQRNKYKSNKGEEMIDWMNMIQLKWGNLQLRDRLLNLYGQNFSKMKFLEQDTEKNLIESIVQNSTLNFLKPSNTMQVRVNSDFQQSELI